MASWFLCHTWGLARSRAELQGGQGQGHQGVPLQVKKHSLFPRVSSVILTWLAMCMTTLEAIHTINWPMERRNNVKKMRTKHLGYLFTYRVKCCTLSAFTVLGLHGWYRSHKLHKQINAESKFPLPNFKTPLFLNILIYTQLLLYSHNTCQMRLRMNSLMNYFHIYGFCSLFRSTTKRIITKSTGLGPQGAWVFNCWAARLD